MAMPPALVVSRHYAGMGVVKGLGMMGVPIALLGYMHPKLDVSRYVTWYVPVPHPEKEEADFISKILGLAGHFSGGMLIPATDEALVAVAKHKAALEAHFVVACPDWEIVQRCIEKQRTYRLAEEIGLSVPATATISSLEDIEREGPGFVYPALLKPSQSHLFQDQFHTKMLPVSSFDELVSVFRRVEASGLTYMLQEYVPGPDSAGVNYNSYRSQSGAPVEFTARKVRNAPPRYGSPRVVVTEFICEILEAGRALLQALDLKGFSCTEFKYDQRDGQYKLMEVNARHNRSAMLAVHSGVNFPWIEYADRMLGIAPQLAEAKAGVYWVDGIEDLKFSLKHWRDERYSLSSYLRPYTSPHVDALLDFQDLRPWLKRALWKFHRVVPITRTRRASL